MALRYVAAALIYFMIVLIVVNSIKTAWGRMRFREMTDQEIRQNLIWKHIDNNTEPGAVAVSAEAEQIFQNARPDKSFRDAERNKLVWEKHKLMDKAGCPIELDVRLFYIVYLHLDSSFSIMS